MRAKHGHALATAKGGASMAVVIRERHAHAGVGIFWAAIRVFTFCATAPLPDVWTEFLLAVYLRKQSIELIKCETNDPSPGECRFCH